MRCFLDMSLNTHNFANAREIVKKYEGYPVESWAKLFDQVRRTLVVEDEDFEGETDKKNVEEFQAKVIQENDHFKIIQPADTSIRVEFYEVNL